MRIERIGAVLLLGAMCGISLQGQKEHRQPLNDAQIDQIREAGIDPNGRIKLYVKFIGERVDTIRGFSNRGRSAARAHRLDDELLDLAALMDELGANLDQYGDRKADMRKALKALNDVMPDWLHVLQTLPSEPGFQLSQKDALEATKDIADDASQLLKEQTAYFAEHKDEKGQERAEPK